jgi:hypothetical protein
MHYHYHNSGLDSNTQPAVILMKQSFRGDPGSIFWMATPFGLAMTAVVVK